MAFWGDLDPPLITRQNSVRRRSNDDRGDAQQLQYPPRQNPQATPNRISVQSQAYTVSTQDSFVSPTTPSFKEEGLTPRPPSFPYGVTGGYGKDYLDKRRQRASREADTENTVPPPAAPDVPRLPPPVSYKLPYNNTGPPTSYQAPVRSRSNRRSDSQADANQAGPVGSNRGTHAEAKVGRSRVEREELSIDTDYRKDTKDRDPIGEGLDKPRDYPDKGMIRRGTVGARKDRPEYHDPAPPTRSRQASATETEAQRRREWAPDRSPLQRLELTLNSITKEEKRARVEEAELLAREAKAGRGGDRHNQNSVRSGQRPAKPDTLAQTEPQSLVEAGLVRSLSNKQKDELQRSGTIERKKPMPTDPAPTRQLGKGFEYRPQEEITSTTRKPEKSSVPQRGPSFRERAIGPAIAGVALPRSTSNKLKKDPPGDPWYNRRIEAEKAFVEVTPRRPSVDARRNTDTTTGGPLGSAPIATSSRKTDGDAGDKAPKDSVPPGSAEEVDRSSDEDFLQPAPVRRNSKKIEQLTGHKIHNGLPKALPLQRQLHADPQALRGKLGPETSQQHGTSQEHVEIKTTNGTKYALAPEMATGSSGRDKVARGPDGQHFSDIAHRRHSQYEPGDGLYVPHQSLDEWKNGSIGALTGALLDLEVREPDTGKDKAWWETGSSRKRRPSASKKPKVEIYDDENENSNAPTQFNPPLYLKCGPLLRYCGLRREKIRTRHGPDNTAVQETWRGSVMIVTTDSKCTYDPAPNLRLFAQPVTLLPPPPDQVDGGAGGLAPEYVDPIAGLPKIGRDGRTLFVRPVEELEEGKDLSTDETDNGLFETRRSTHNIPASNHDGTTDQKTSTSGRNQKSNLDGQRLGKYVDVKGIRLHAEQGVTFWRFNIEIELRDQQQRIAYRINRGPAMGFWVPARGHSMNIMFHSCNGFSLSVNPDQFSGPDPMWRDVLNTHQTRPFHVMIGGGDQIYNDSVMKNTKLFSHWLSIKNRLEKHNAPFTRQMQEELETFYLERYSMWFSQGLFGLANSQIPMVNIFDDHDIIDGFGSYPDEFMDTPVFVGLGAIAFKYYLLFQHQSVIDEGEETEPSWLLGARPGPYIKELSRSVFMSLGSPIAFLGLDCRTERQRGTIMTDDTYIKVFDRLNEQIIKGETRHLIVCLGVPIAYPRLVWLENILTSSLMSPIKVLGKAPMFGNLISAIDGGVEVLDDLNDHWTAKNHKEERKELVLDFQALSAEKSVRITILSGDVHLAAIGQFFSNPKLAIPKHQDFRYMPNVISSAIVNTPPPNAMADILNRRDKVHHLDDVTDENMIPIFTKDVNSTNRNNKCLLPRRNWCSIREYNPDLTPPSTPTDERSPSPPPRGGLLRRLSSSRGPSYRPDVGPPPSRGLMRNISLRGRLSADSEGPGPRPRTLSLSRKDFITGNLFRRGSKRRPDDGGINGYGASSDEDELPDQQLHPPKLRGGAGNGSYFPQSDSAPFSRTRVRRDAYIRDDTNGYSSNEESPSRHRNPNSQQASAQEPQRRPFHRTPTGMSEKQRRRLGENYQVNLEGGLDICLNVEVSQKDPAGITCPYRLLVPALWYEDEDDGQIIWNRGHESKGTGMMRLVSLKRGKIEKSARKGKEREMEDSSA